MMPYNASRKEAHMATASVEEAYSVFCPSFLPASFFDFKKKVSTYHKTGQIRKMLDGN